MQGLTEVEYMRPSEGQVALKNSCVLSKTLGGRSEKSDERKMQYKYKSGAAEGGDDDYDLQEQDQEPQVKQCETHGWTGTEEIDTGLSNEHGGGRRFHSSALDIPGSDEKWGGY
jgi:hypothetical protein